MKSKKTIQNEISRLTGIREAQNPGASLEALAAKQALRWALEYEAEPRPSSFVASGYGVEVKW